MTPLGQLVFFSHFLATAGLFHDWVKACPLVFASNNAPALNDLLGTITLAILAGQLRYSHVTALRADTVNPAGLGMSKVCSEDSVHPLANRVVAANLAARLAPALDHGHGRNGQSRPRTELAAVGVMRPGPQL